MLRSSGPPRGVLPRLWCPPLTHYDGAGAIDHARMEAHWGFMRRSIRGFLVPGSTGDAWEMTPSEQDAVIAAALDRVASGGGELLLGALHPDAPETLAAISSQLDGLKRRTGRADSREAMAAAGVRAFTVCPPAGEDRTQEGIEAGLAAILDLGVPVALYQLPQVTRNEMSPGLVAGLAAQYPNLILLKDSSGDDRVARSGFTRDLFLVRGAEGDYAGWLTEGGGPYHGLLLSTANCFPGQLQAVIGHLEQGRVAEARALSGRLSQVAAQVFDLVADLPEGNAFANANKAMDHFMAWGLKASRAPAPRLHAGSEIPRKLLARVAIILAEAGFFPDQGYLG
ncbi:MAG: dihydrodipicolinate synthase family protein [Candidatus Krumholzibacteriia bacterium]